MRKNKKEETHCVFTQIGIVKFLEESYQVYILDMKDSKPENITIPAESIVINGSIMDIRINLLQCNISYYSGGRIEFYDMATMLMEAHDHRPIYISGPVPFTIIPIKGKNNGHILFFSNNTSSFWKTVNIMPGSCIIKEADTDMFKVNYDLTPQPYNDVIYQLIHSDIDELIESMMIAQPLFHKETRKDRVPNPYFDLYSKLEGIENKYRKKFNSLSIKEFVNLFNESDIIVTFDRKFRITHSIPKDMLCIYVKYTGDFSTSFAEISVAICLAPELENPPMIPLKLYNPGVYYMAEDLINTNAELELYRTLYINQTGAFCDLETELKKKDYKILWDFERLLKKLSYDDVGKLLCYYINSNFSLKDILQKLS